MTLAITLFDHLHLTDGVGGTFSRMRPRAQRLLAYLLLYRERRHGRSHIAFTLWPDIPEPQARAELRRALNDLRAALPAADSGQWIIGAGDELRWNRDASYWLDVVVFQTLLDQATPAALHDAVALYRGDLLATWDDEWLLGERERLRQLQSTALRQLIALHHGLGQYETALALARRALEHDPFAEAVHRDVIALQYQAGDRAAALAAYDQLATLLRDELDAEPMAETQALRTTILKGLPLAPHPSPIIKAGALAQSQSSRPVPVGRDVEMQRLLDLWTSATIGQGRLVIMAGEAGVGKSHLAFHLADAVTRDGGLALIGHCYELERALPYQAIIEMLRSAASHLRHSNLAPSHRVAVARLASDVLGATANTVPPPGLSPDELREQLFEALLQAFLALAGSQPLLLLIEDAHWAAESTLDWLSYITPRLDHCRMLVVVTYRSDEVGVEHALARLRRRLSRTSNVATMSLQPLSRVAHRELVGRLSNLPDAVSEPIADRLYQETTGNPFYLHEVVRGLIESGQLAAGDGPWRGSFIAAAPGVEVPLPDSLRETIMSRLARLAEHSRMFIQAAAVAGPIFAYEDVRLAGGWEEEEALAALDDLLARGLVMERNGQDNVAFAHQLVQEAVYTDLTAPRRAFCHRRLAEAIQTLRPDDVEALARHFTLAGERKQAVDYACRAAERSTAVFAYDEAIRHLRTALDLLENEAWPERRLAVMEQLADVYRLKHEISQAVELYQAAVDMCGGVASSDHLVVMRLYRKLLQELPNLRSGAGFATFEAVAQAAATSRASLESSLQLTPNAPAHPEMVHLLIALSTDAWKTRFPADNELAERYARAAVEMAEHLDEPTDLSVALAALANAFALQERFRDQLQVTLRQLALSRDRRFGSPHERVVILLNTGKALARVGDYADAISHLLEAEQRSSQMQTADLLYAALVEQAHCWYKLDRWDEVLVVAGRCRELQRGYPQERTGPVCFAVSLSASVRALRGECDRAASLRTEAQAIMTTVSGPPERWRRSHHY